MATSGSKSVAVTSHDTLKFSWTLVSQSIESNTSSVRWRMQLITDSYGRINSSVPKSWSVTVNGKKYSGTNYISIDNDSTKTLATGLVDIEHNADGSKTFSYSFKQEFAITFSDTYIGTKSGSGSGALEDIIRLSTVEAENGTLGVSQFLSVTQYSTNFTHTITYTCGEASGIVCENSSAVEEEFTPNLDLARQNTTGANVSVILTIETLNEGESLGSTTKQITCTIPDSVKPVVDIAVTDPLGHNNAYGRYIQGISKFKIDVSAVEEYGASIVSYNVTADGKGYTETSITTDVISGAGSLEIAATVTDSRGRITAASVTVPVAEYAAPKITKLTTKRCDATGANNTNGEYLAVIFSSEVAPVENFNQATYSLRYKKTSASQYTEVTLDEYTGMYRVDAGMFVFAAETYSSYDIILTVSDAFKDTPRGTTGASVSKLFSFLKRGLGFAFGKVAELENVLDIAFRTRNAGGFLFPELPSEVDLDTLTTPNKYVLKAANTYPNAPIEEAHAFLDIIGVAEELLVQRFTTLSKTTPKTFERVYDAEGWGAWNNTLLASHPVGKLYISDDPTSPEILFGGKWERIEDVFLLAAGKIYAAGSTGGEAEHVLTIDEMPSHNHGFKYSQNAIASGSTFSRFNDDGTSVSDNIITNVGGGAAHNNMPPYITVYVWKRTA